MTKVQNQITADSTNITETLTSLKRIHTVFLAPTQPRQIVIGQHLSAQPVNRLCYNHTWKLVGFVYLYYVASIIDLASPQICWYIASLVTQISIIRTISQATLTFTKAMWVTVVVISKSWRWRLPVIKQHRLPKRY